MKQLLLSFAMLLCIGSTFGQTADKLIKKYKGMKGVQYENITKKIANMKEEDSPDMYKASRGLTKVEYLSGVLSSDKTEKLQKDLDALKGFERVYFEKHNSNDEPLSMLKGDFKLFNNIQYYAVEEGDCFKELIARIDADANVGNLVTLIHMQGSIKQEDVPLIIQMDENTDMDDITKDLDKGNVLFVIDGKELPELRSLKEAQEYMEKNNFHFNNESWIVGSAVKEKYPNTDRKVVIEFSRADKKEQK